MAKTVKKKATASRKQKKKVVTIGIAHINAGYNNTLISITDLTGNVLGFSSSGKHFKGSRKSTPYAAQVAAKEVAGQVVSDFGMKEIHVRVTGAGSGRDSAIRGLATEAGYSVGYSDKSKESDSDDRTSSGDASSGGSSGGSGAGGLRLLSIEDITPQPHNGCRAKKQRRV